MTADYKTILTILESGEPLTEECEGVIMPADYSFKCVNNYVHTFGRQYEELEALCLGMACEIDRLREQPKVGNHASDDVL